MRRITLIDVAAVSGYSVRTVKKVVSGNGYVSDNARTTILSAIEKSGYRKNEIASTLAKNKQHLILIIIRDLNVFLDESKRGFIRAADALAGFGIHIEFAQVLDLSHQKKLLSDAAKRDNLSAVILHAISMHELDNEINTLVDSGVPVFTYNNDAPNSRRMSFLGPRAYESGRIGAQILANYISQKGKVLVVNTYGDATQTQERTHGFIDKVKESYPEISFEDIRIPLNPQTYYDTLKGIMLKEDIKALFCTDEHCLVAADLLHDLDRKDVVLLGFDISEESKELMRDGYLTIIVDQKTDYQSETLLRLVADYLLFGRVPPPVVSTEVSILISEFLR